MPARNCRLLTALSPAISHSADMNERFTSFLSSLCRTARTQRLFVSPQKSRLGTPIAIRPNPVTRCCLRMAGENEISAMRLKREAEEKHIQQLNAELQSLQEIQRNQARPGNLVAVRKSGTPILAKPAIGSRVLFTATSNDEFEFLDAQGEWIHVQISGESRGYIQRSGVELPELLAARAKSPNVTASDHTQVAFRVAREETSIFPGDWDALRGKTVKIYTVQPVSSQSKETRATAKLDFAASLFREFSNASTRAADSIEGIVVIFDSADGGIVASNLSTAREFAIGSLSAEAFWNKCYKDPSDAFR